MVINPSAQSQPAIRQQNRSLVLRALLAKKALSRVHLAEVTGLSAMALSRISRELIDVGLLRESEKLDRDGLPGRRRIRLTLTAEGAYVVGVMISAYDQCIALADAGGEVIRSEPLNCARLGDSDAVLAEVANAIERLVATVDIQRMLGVGVVIVGSIDRHRGRVLSAPYLGWGQVNLAAELEAALTKKKIGLPVVVENLNNALNLAESQFGSCRGKQNVFQVRVATFIGGSVLADGRLVGGARFSAGKIGQMWVRPVAAPYASPTRLDAAASGWAILAELGLTNAREYAPQHIARLAHKLRRCVARAATEPHVAAVFQQAGYRLGQALADIVLVVDPEAVLLCGIVGQAPAYVAGVKAAWEQISDTPAGGLPRLLLGTVEGDRAATALALNEFLFSPRLDLQRLRQAKAIRPCAAAARRRADSQPRPRRAEPPA